MPRTIPFHCTLLHCGYFAVLRNLSACTLLDVSIACRSPHALTVGCNVMLWHVGRILLAKFSNTRIFAKCRVANGAILSSAIRLKTLQQRDIYSSWPLRVGHLAHAGAYIASCCCGTRGNRMPCLLHRIPLLLQRAAQPLHLNRTPLALLRWRSWTSRQATAAALRQRMCGNTRSFSSTPRRDGGVSLPCLIRNWRDTPAVIRLSSILSST